MTAKETYSKTESFTSLDTSSKVFQKMAAYNIYGDSGVKSSESIDTRVRYQSLGSFSKDESVEKKLEKYSKKLSFLVQNDEFFSGEETKTTYFLDNLYYKETSLFPQICQKSFLELFRKSPDQAAKILSFFSAVDYSRLGEMADMILLSACAHKNPLVLEAALRSVESWEQKNHLEYLENIRDFDQEWLNEYKNDVEAYLRTQ